MLELEQIRYAADFARSTKVAKTTAYAALYRHILSAHHAGHSTRQIARAAGISHQRVSQILKKKN